jgi:hypothetical protein
LSSDWPSEKPELTRKAREAAEALFRPRPPAAAATATPVSVSNLAPVAQPRSQPPADQPPAARQPRILAAPPPRRAEPEPVPVPEPAPVPKAAAPSRPRQRRIPAGEHRRIATLVTYGMTAAEAAALYEVSVETIEKIVAAAAGATED